MLLYSNRTYVVAATSTILWGRKMAGGEEYYSINNKKWVSRQANLSYSSSF